MSTESKSAVPPTPVVRADIRKEIRFAVVLYGGVSLAVYISGVVRELLAMVRATAPRDATPEASGPLLEPNAAGSIGAYQRLANRLNRPSVIPDAQGTGVQNAADDQTAYTRFVIDVVSGTSAGGLNGVYLAKALARAQHVDHLRQLWLDVGDIEGLLNTTEHDPKAVLSGAKMLNDLHAAFEKMEDQAVVDGARSLVDDVQCFATATDLRGLPMQLQVADGVVIEDRHKHVFRFSFSNGTWTTAHSDFQQKHNPNLALASRSTSAFPGAFAPARLADVDGIKAALDDPGGMYPDYTGTAAAALDKGMDSVFDARRHAYADGGILNNKPFSHAIGALASRRGGKPSDRKLIYVEPSPDSHLGIEAAHTTVMKDLSEPNFFSVIQSALSLPGSQTIREDLERVAERNRTIDRIHDLIADLPVEVRLHRATVEAALKASVGAGGAGATTAANLLEILAPTSPEQAAKAFNACDVGDMIQLFGLGYGGYHRLKVAAATDTLGLTVTRLAGFDDESDEVGAIRALTRAWRDLNFRPYTHELPASEQMRATRLRAVVEPIDAVLAARIDQRKTENYFMFQWDLRYRLRRLDFIINQIDDLFCLDDRGQLLLSAFGVDKPGGWMSGARRKELGELAKRFSVAYTGLRTAAEELDHSSAFGENIEELGIGPAELTQLLAKRGDALEDLAVTMVARRIVAFDRLAEQIRGVAAAASLAASAAVMQGFEAASAAARSSTEPEPRDVIRASYDNYESVDRITFPVFYQTNVGEEIDVVTTVRVSPADARALAPKRRLGGETLGHFGGFFAARWRAVDFLWGQLDAAERIIHAVCMESDEVSETDRDELVHQAQIAILGDTANVAGIAPLEAFQGDDRAELRYAFLRDTPNMALGPLSEGRRKFAVAVSTAVPILGHIAAKNGPGFVGRIAAWVSLPATLVARSLFDWPAKLAVVSVSWVVIVSAAFGGVLMFNLARPIPPGWPGVVRVAAASAAIVGCIGLAAVAGVTLVIRGRLKSLVNKALPAMTPSQGASGQKSPP